ncbi:unnamed protein product [Trifolium pratense]|uniref:Uncharacterized protein n=1 Tax=Trifolium pratense TaxID=57577 RepID=A0ACB0JMF1_TRIPR|nr:unnamed protein product [Trifolium pratense]
MSFNASWTKQLGLRPNEPWGKREGGEKGAREREKELEIKEESLIIIDLRSTDYVVIDAESSVKLRSYCDTGKMVYLVCRVLYDSWVFIWKKMYLYKGDLFWINK